MVLNVHTFEEKRQTAVCMYSGNHHTPRLCSLQEAPPHTAAMMVDEAIGCWVGGPVTDLMLTSECATGCCAATV